MVSRWFLPLPQENKYFLELSPKILIDKAFFPTSPLCDFWEGYVPLFRGGASHKV